MNLKDALLCIDCDEVFVVEESSCNIRCPVCTSSVFTRLSVWVKSWPAYENSEGRAKSAVRDEAPAKRRGMEIVRSTPIAA